MYVSLAELMTLVHPILPITVRQDSHSCQEFDERVHLQLPCCVRPLLPQLFILDIAIYTHKQSARHTKATLEVDLVLCGRLAVDIKLLTAYAVQSFSKVSLLDTLFPNTGSTEAPRCALFHQSTAPQGMQNDLTLMRQEREQRLLILIGRLVADPHVHLVSRQRCD